LTKSEIFGLALVGAMVVFAMTTIVAMTGLGVSLGEDEDVLFVLRIASLLVAIGSAIGLVVT
jgi:hypothetical protein